MKLLSLNLDPPKYFEGVTFDSGINFIYAHKDENNGSINGVGKSLFLDFIDFALLGHFNSKLRTRLSCAYNAGLLANLKTIIIFEVNDNEYTLIRSFNDPLCASLFSYTHQIKNENIYILMEKLFEIICFRDSYLGFSNPKWFKFLKRFYCKIQKVSEERFTNPVSFSNADINTHYLMHLFLLNLNNASIFEYYNLRKKSSEYKNAIASADNYLLSNSGLPNISAVSNRLDQLNARIENLKYSLFQIDFSPYYQDLQAEADSVTSEIKELLFQNMKDSQTLANMDDEDSFSSENVVNQAEEIYNELQTGLSDYLVHSLEDAVSFRKSIRKSKSEFTQRLKSKLKGDILLRRKRIQDLKEIQAKIIEKLSSLSVYSDFKYYHSYLDSLIEQKAVLQSQYDLRSEFIKQNQSFKNNISNAFINISDSIKEQQSEIQDFSNLLSSIYTSIFGLQLSSEPFSIDIDTNRKNINFNILLDDIYSHGRNQGRTLVYDLAVLINSVKQNLKAPRFLIHDGIFDSLDERHLLSLYKFIQTQLDDGIDLQYIVTLNHLNDSFTKNYSLNHDKLMDIAKVKVSNSNKLLGVDF